MKEQQVSPKYYVYIPVNWVCILLTWTTNSTLYYVSTHVRGMGWVAEVIMATQKT